MPITVRGLAIAPVKGMRLLPVEEIELLRSGARGNRRFFVVDERDRMVNAKSLGELETIRAECSDGRLRLTLPDGRVEESELALGGSVSARFFSRTIETRVLEGPLSAALSQHVGQALRLVQAEGSIDRGPIGAASLISRGSLARLAEVARERAIDVRRFRMLIEIDGVDPHEEDRWIERSSRVGEAEIRWRGHVGRCLVTSRDPDSGAIDLPTLDLLGSYREGQDTTEPLAFGIYGEVIREGRVSVGDELVLT